MYEADAEEFNQKEPEPYHDGECGKLEQPPEKQERCDTPSDPRPCRRVAAGVAAEAFAGSTTALVVLARRWLERRAKHVKRAAIPC